MVLPSFAQLTIGVENAAKKPKITLKINYMSEFPEGTTVIKAHFYTNQSFPRLTAFPEALQRIEEYAFFGSEFPALTYFPKNVFIGTQAFSMAKLPVLNYLPENMRAVEPLAFAGANLRSLVELPINLTQVKQRAFFEADLYRLTALPDDLKIVGKEAFARANLKSLKDVAKDKMTIADDAFANAFIPTIEEKYETRALILLKGIDDMLYHAQHFIPKDGSKASDEHKNIEPQLTFLYILIKYLLEFSGTDFVTNKYTAVMLGMYVNEIDDKMKSLKQEDFEDAVANHEFLQSFTARIRQEGDVYTQCQRILMHVMFLINGFLPPGKDPMGKNVKIAEALRSCKQRLKFFEPRRVR